MSEIKCEHCGCLLSKSVRGVTKLVVTSRIVAFDKGGAAEMVCPGCGKDTSLPVRFYVKTEEVNSKSESFFTLSENFS